MSIFYLLFKKLVFCLCVFSVFRLFCFEFNAIFGDFLNNICVIIVCVFYQLICDFVLTKQLLNKAFCSHFIQTMCQNNLLRPPFIYLYLSTYLSTFSVFMYLIYIHIHIYIYIYTYTYIYIYIYTSIYNIYINTYTYCIYTLI